MDHIPRIEPDRRLIGCAANEEVVGAGYDFVINHSSIDIDPPAEVETERALIADAPVLVTDFGPSPAIDDGASFLHHRFDRAPCEERKAQLAFLHVLEMVADALPPPEVGTGNNQGCGRRRRQGGNGKDRGDEARGPIQFVFDGDEGFHGYGQKATLIPNSAADIPLHVAAIVFMRAENSTA